jgi:ADP-ribose pyrophosphatase YjhB (NUDIX family)
MQTNVHLRVRALICHDGKVLVARPKNKNHTSLPGGHVENDESMIVALRREMMEECGKRVENERYLGVVEQLWIEDDVRQWEIVHYFSAEISNLATDANITSQEEKLEFLWIAPEDFEKENFLPLSVRELIIAYLASDTKIWWASTF